VVVPGRGPFQRSELREEQRSGQEATGSPLRGLSVGVIDRDDSQ
jgi:hypothetical protein